MRTDRSEVWEQSDVTEIEYVTIARSLQKSRKDWLSRFIVTCFYLIILTFKISFTQPITVEGSVITTNLLPVKYASVTFINQDDTTQKYSAITDTCGYYRLTVPSGIDHFDYKLPSNIELAQNYPNPFNPSTTIAYDLPQESHVMLTIYDILGREVIRLIDESQPAGIQKVIWYGRDSYGQLVPSGIYLYSLKTTSGFNATKKMVFMR